MAESVLARLDAGAEPRQRRRPGWKSAAGLIAIGAMAAAVVVAVFALSGPREVAAAPTPEAAIRDARVAYTRNATRCYRVTIDARGREVFPLLAQEAERTLCTRGDRFVVEPGFGGKGAWGSDGAGRVWVAPTLDGAAAFTEVELPQGLRNVVKIHELEPDTLLDEVLASFEMDWSEPPTASTQTYSVEATRRGEAPPLQLASARLVIDKINKTVRSLELKRRGLTNGYATLTFALTGAVERDDAAFTPEGHIRRGAPVYGRSKPLLRHRLLRQHLGDALLGG
ncbi:hypothetical protein [Gemmata obscuriglobus]|uniref:Uncharacterized protein n=1 Tax=Gemmata obscuriglobus TaxID=114 RepID=A0A2Z3GXT4_9BACT|nr:hypothetical protein [Gemmata obscuriglobus]AWM36832.1 hypothetical protein C1280_07245 [Gemmata obscuriglobus]